LSPKAENSGSGPREEDEDGFDIDVSKPTAEEIEQVEQQMEATLRGAEQTQAQTTVPPTSSSEPSAMYFPNLVHSIKS
jgi:hypothetical protein